MELLHPARPIVDLALNPDLAVVEVLGALRELHLPEPVGRARCSEFCAVCCCLELTTLSNMDMVAATSSLLAMVLKARMHNGN